MKKIVAMVPVKLNNERLPGKNTKKFFNGKALLTVFLETLIKVREINEIYVFCSNESIVDYLVPKVKYLKRPEFLDTPQATPQDIISEFMKIVDADIYMVAHCTSPFVTQKHFEDCINAVTSEKYDSAFTAEKVQKLFWKKNGETLNFNPENIPRTQELEPLFAEVSAAYVFTKEVFTKLHRRIGTNPCIVEVNGIESVDIDRETDFIIADAIYKKLICHEE